MSSNYHARVITIIEVLSIPLMISTIIFVLWTGNNINWGDSMNYLQLFRIVYTFVFVYMLLLVLVFLLSVYGLILLASFVKKYRDNPKRFRFEDTLGINEEPSVVFDKTMAILDKLGICILDKNREEGYIRAVKKYPLSLLDWKILLRFIQENADHGSHTRVAFSVIPEGSLVFLDRVIAKNSTKKFSSYYGISN